MKKRYTNVLSSTSSTSRIAPDKACGRPQSVDDRAVGVQSNHPVQFGDVVKNGHHVVAEVRVRNPDLIDEVARQRHAVGRRTARVGEASVTPELRHVERQRVVLTHPATPLNRPRVEESVM